MSAATENTAKPIGVGDLVYLVPGPNPATDKYAGSVRTVKAACQSYRQHWLLEPETFESNGLPLAWHECRLKRIPPLSELEGEKRDEEITA